jgi:hypothetical protein
VYFSLKTINTGQKSLTSEKKRDCSFFCIHTPKLAYTPNGGKPQFHPTFGRHNKVYCSLFMIIYMLFLHKGRRPRQNRESSTVSRLTPSQDSSSSPRGTHKPSSGREGSWRHSPFAGTF